LAFGATFSYSKPLGLTVVPSDLARPGVQLSAVAALPALSAIF
jgi:hypothetical protein